MVSLPLPEGHLLSREPLVAQLQLVMQGEAQSHYPSDGTTGPLKVKYKEVDKRNLQLNIELLNRHP